MLYPPLTFTEWVSGGDFRWNKAPVSISRCVTELKGDNELAWGALHPSFLLFLLGSFLSWALTASTDKKMIKDHGLNHNPIHVPDCSADNRKSCVRSFFSNTKVLTAFHISRMCVRLPELHPKIHLHCVSTLCFWMFQTWRSVNTDPGSKISMRQIRVNTPLSLKYISLSRHCLLLGNLRLQTKWERANSIFFSQRWECGQQWNAWNDLVKRCFLS